MTIHFATGDYIETKRGVEMISYWLDDFRRLAARFERRQEAGLASEWEQDALIAYGTACLQAIHSMIGGAR